MKLTQKEVEHIARLARIKLNEKEIEKIAEDLGLVLNYFDKLKEINTEGIEPTAQVTGLENIFREDKINTEMAEISGEKRGKILAQFPHKKEDHLKVKQVFESR